MLVHRVNSRPPPGRVAYVDGRYMRHGDAGVHVEDRGLQFADSVYEVIAVSNTKLVDATPHLERLERSLGEIGIKISMGRTSLVAILHEDGAAQSTQRRALISSSYARHGHARSCGTSRYLSNNNRHCKTDKYFTDGSAA